MVDMTFEPEMLETLAKMKGKTLKSYEGYFPVSGPIISRVARINLGSFAVDLKCWYKEVENWREVDEDDPPCVLSCEERALGDPFPIRSDGVRAILVGERVTGVDVVTYHIEEGGVPFAVMDMAVAIRTRGAVYTFSRGVWFDMNFNFAVSSDIEVGYSEEEFAEGWQPTPDEGELPEVKVSRTVTSL